MCITKEFKIAMEEYKCEYFYEGYLAKLLNITLEERTITIINTFQLLSNVAVVDFSSFNHSKYAKSLLK